MDHRHRCFRTPRARVIPRRRRYRRTIARTRASSDSRSSSPAYRSRPRSPRARWVSRRRPSNSGATREGWEKGEKGEKAHERSRPVTTGHDWSRPVIGTVDLDDDGLTDRDSSRGGGVDSMEIPYFFCGLFFHFNLSRARGSRPVARLSVCRDERRRDGDGRARSRRARVEGEVRARMDGPAD